MEKHRNIMEQKLGKMMISLDDHGILQLNNSLHTTLASRSSEHLENHAGALRIRLSNTEMLHDFRKLE